ncbi:MAG: hypothetical protein JWO86_1472 [Myxococcaceae bacterium]|nr:hypothetical protein [Myxococcaceae bacterium]
MVSERVNEPPSSKPDDAPAASPERAALAVTKLRHQEDGKGPVHRGRFATNAFRDAQQADAARVRLVVP